MDIAEKLQALVERAKDIERRLADPDLATDEMIRLSKEQAGMSEVAEAARDYSRYRKGIDDATASLSDPELKSLAETELAELKPALADVEEKIKTLLIPTDEADDKNAILEIRAGTGGEEAALFAANVLRMYERYAVARGWSFQLQEVNETGIGGIKEAVAVVAGLGAYARLKFESGVHRVQRVPETEASGRIHTSAATVAVLPEAGDVDVFIDEKDLKIDTYRSSGAGGQHVNKTESAIRITHVPTGLVVECQEERSQHKNRDKAMRRLRSYLYDFERQKRDRDRASARKTQVGTGDRSERIRTYNFPQGRVSDHRINLTLYKINEVMAGTALDEIIDALIADDRLKRLAEIE